MEIFNPIFTYITDSSKKLPAKVIIIIISLLLILFLDNILGFTYYYNIEKKISIVTQLNKVIEDSSIQKNDKLTLSELRLQVIKHKSYKDQFLNYFSSSNLNNKTLPSESKSDKIYYYINIFTAAIVPIGLIIVSVIIGIPYFFKKKSILDDSNLVLVIKLVGIISTFYIIAFFEAKTLLLIPIIGGHIFYNYFLNIIINFCLVVIVYYLIAELPKKIKQPN